MPFKHFADIKIIAGSEEVDEPVSFHLYVDYNKNVLKLKYYNETKHYTSDMTVAETINDFLHYEEYEYKPPIVSDLKFNSEEASDEEINNFLNVPWKDYINSYKRIKATIYY
jgi:hypothetical protein